MVISPVDKTNCNKENVFESSSSERSLAIPEILEKIFIYSQLSEIGNLSQVNRNINHIAKMLQNAKDYPKTYQKILLQTFAHFKKSVEEITSGFISLSKKDRISELKLLINSAKFNEIDLDSFRSVLLQVTSKGHEQLIETLMASPKFIQIGVDSLGKFLKESAERGYIQIIKKIVDSNRFEEINGSYLGKALYQATLHRHEELAIELLSICHSKESIPADPIHFYSNDWGEAFKYAAQNGLDQFINQLIILGTPLDKMILRQLADSLFLASSKGHLKVVELIIASSRFQEITKKDLNKAYQKALSMKHEQIAKILKESIDQRARCVIS